MIGETWFYRITATERDPVELLGVQVGIGRRPVVRDGVGEESHRRGTTRSGRRAREFFPNPGYTNNFVFKALPRRWGVDLTYRFWFEDHRSTDMATTNKLPSRLHHTAYVLGTWRRRASSTRMSSACRWWHAWCESDELFGAKLRLLSAVLRARRWQRARVLSVRASAEDHAVFGPKMPDTPFHHVALKVDADVQEADRASACDGRFYASRRRTSSSTAIAARCTSIDPDGMIVEFTVDHAGRWKRSTPRAVPTLMRELKRWLAGEHRSNNMFR